MNSKFIRFSMVASFMALEGYGCLASGSNVVVASEEEMTAMAEELIDSMPSWSKEQYHANIDALFSGELAEPVEDVTDVNVADGALLPMQIYAIDRGRTDYIPEVPTGNTHEDMLNVMKLYFIGACSYMGGNGNYRYFLDAILERKDSLPPVYGDVIIYRISRVMFPWMNGSTLGAPMEFWEEMGQGRNPIYRLLAIRGARASILPEYSKFAVLEYQSIDPRVEFWSAEQKVSLYKKFLNEQDPYMLECVYLCLASSPSPESLTILTEQLSNTVVLENEDLNAMLLRMIDNVNEELSGQMYQRSMETSPEDSEYFDFVNTN